MVIVLVFKEEIWRNISRHCASEYDNHMYHMLTENKYMTVWHLF